MLPSWPQPSETVSTQVLCDFPHTAGAIPPDYLLDLVPLIRPRAFSIASSLLVRARTGLREARAGASGGAAGPGVPAGLPPDP